MHAKLHTLFVNYFVTDEYRGNKLNALSCKKRPKSLVFDRFLTLLIIPSACFSLKVPWLETKSAKVSQTCPLMVPINCF